MPTTTRRRWSRAPLAAAAAFAGARIRARPTRGLVAGIGIAIAMATLLVTSGAPIIAGDATLRRALEGVAPGERSITVAVSVNTKTVEELRTIDAQVRKGLRGPGVGDVRAEVEYRALAASDGTVFRLAGVDRLVEVVTVFEGRMPATCSPTRCEVLIIGAGTSVTPQPELGLEIVGRAVLDDPGILSGGFSPGADEVILLGDGVEAVGAVQSLELIGRSIGWIASIDPATIRVSDIDSVLAAAARTANSFAEGGGTVDLPRRALVGARSRADTARNRVQLAAAQGVVLVVAFALLAAASNRRGHRAARDLLRRRGAARSAINVFTMCEAAWPVVIGLVVGLPAGLGASAWLARAWDLDGAETVLEMASVESLLPVLVGALVVLVGTAGVMAGGGAAATPGSRRTPPLGRRWRPTPIDAIGAGALATAALTLDRGSTTPASLVAKGDPLLAALPVLAAVTVAWVAIRVVPLLVRGTARLLGRRAPLVRTALGEIARRPAIPLATAGFLAAATMLGLFSLGYRATLAAGAHDQAAFSVPLDLTLTAGPALVRPSALEPAAGWSALAEGARGTEVLRRGVTVRSPALTNDTVTVIGIDPTTVRDLRGWRADFGPSRDRIADVIAPALPPPILGTPLPDDAVSLILHGGGDLRITDVAVILERRNGTWHEESASYDAAVDDQMMVMLDPADAGGRLIGFRMGQPGTDSAKIEHHLGEGLTSAAFFTATIALDAIDVRTADGQTSELDVDWTALGSDGAVVTQMAEGLSVALRLQGSTALVLPLTPDALGPLSVVVDPVTATAAGDDGRLVIDVPGPARMTVRVGAVANRFPGAPSRFMVVDRAQLRLAFDLFDPGYGTATEVWLAVPAAQEARLAGALDAPPFDDLVVTRRHTQEAMLRSSPLARFTLGLFAVAGLIAALLAIAAIHLATSDDAAEQAPLHRALAAEGVSPRVLSRMVRTASSAIALAAIAVGVVGALVLLRTVTRVITVTATSSVPNPPLVADVPARALALAVVAIALPCLVAAAFAARAARRSAQGDLLREFG